jgi:serine phosphatase RsbU (regulator of sigma subunit)
VLLPVFWDQLQDRTSQLFVLDVPTMRVLMRFAHPDAHAAEPIVESRREWLAGVTAPSVSKVFELSGYWGNLVCVPLPGGRRLICAVVPVLKIEAQFLSSLNRPDKTGSAMLVDEAGRVLSFINPALVGRNLLHDEPDLEFQSMVLSTLSQDQPVSQTFEKPVVVGGFRLGRVITNVHPVEVPNGRWWLAISSDLAQLDGIINRNFARVFTFAAVAIGLFTLAFSYLAINQIRQRTRLERIKHELLALEIAQARQIQLNWLPRADAPIAGGDVHAVNRPANQISGDFYNWFDLPGGRSCLIIGDVTGHGMAAAFLMATTQLLTRTALQRLDGDPGAAMNAVNGELCGQVFNGQFVTMTILVIDPSAGLLHVATAGHPPPLLSPASGAARLLKIEPQLVLGVEREWEYVTERLDLPRDGTILLYTDGVIEAASEDGRRFDADQLLRCVDEHAGSPSEMIEQVLRTLDRFRGTRELDDDLTMVAVRLSPSVAPRPVTTVSAV